MTTSNEINEMIQKAKQQINTYENIGNNKILSGVASFESSAGKVTVILGVSSYRAKKPSLRITFKLFGKAISRKNLETRIRVYDRVND